MKNFAASLVALCVCASICMGQTLLRQNTATTVRIGPFVDETDGVTAQTGLGGDGGNIETNVRLSKAGGPFGTRSSTTDPAHDTAGWYSLHLSATDTNTLGSLVVAVHDATSYVPVWHEFRVVSSETYARLVEGREYDGAGRVWFVSTSGSDSNTGTRDAPLATFAQAVSSAANGDTIRILSGTFTSASDVNTTKRLTIIGNGRTLTTLRFSGGGGFTPGNGTSVIGVKIENVHMSASSIAVQLNGVTGVSFDSCDISGGVGLAINSIQSRGTVLRHCYIYSDGTTSGAAIISSHDNIEDHTLTTFMLQDCTVISTYQPIVLQDRVCFHAERCMIYAKYTGTSADRCCAISYDYMEGLSDVVSHIYLRLVDCVFRVEATNAGFSAPVGALLTTPPMWNGMLTGEVRGGRVFVSNAGTGQTLHFDARNSPSALRVYGCSHDPTKNNGLVQVVDGDVADVLANTDAISAEVAGVGAKVTTLHDDRLTAARAANLDLVDDIDTRTGAINTKVAALHDDRLTAGRAANLDLVDDIDTRTGAINTKVAALHDDRLTASRAAKLDNLDAPVSGVGGQPISPAFVPRRRTWRFDSDSQVTAPNRIVENRSFDGLVRMEFANAIGVDVAIQSVGSVTIAPTDGVAEPVVGDATRTPDLRAVDVALDATSADAGSYTVTITVTTTDSQTITRKGVFELR